MNSACNTQKPCKKQCRDLDKGESCTGKKEVEAGAEEQLDRDSLRTVAEAGTIAIVAQTRRDSQIEREKWRRARRRNKLGQKAEPALSLKRVVELSLEAQQGIHQCCPLFQPTGGATWQSPGAGDILSEPASATARLQVRYRFPHEQT